MKKLILPIILFTMIMVFPVFAQEDFSGQKISISSDKTAYNEGDVITITGSVQKVIAGDDMIIQVFFEKNLVGVAQVNVTEDGEFTKTFRAKGPMWGNEGSVVIKATYGKESNELSIEFFKKTGTSFTSSYEVDIPDSGTFDVKYTMKGGIVKSITLNPNDLSLDILIDTNTNGALDIEIPRNNIDAVNENGFDEKFIVLIYRSGDENPIQTDFNEIATTGESRSIYVPIKDGDIKIQIIGTKVIPEFGAMIQFILIIAIITTIIITARTRLSLISRL
jgi:predicted secreted protein with PEFG-CTERM motif